MLEQRIENHLCVRVLLYVYNYAHTLAVGFVVNIGNAVYLLILNVIGNGFY